MDKYDNLFDQNEPDKLIRELRGNVIWHWSPNDLSDWRPGEISTAPCRAADRIEQLEAALREIIQEDSLNGKTVFVGDFGKIARKALEGKDD